MRAAAAVLLAALFSAACGSGSGASVPATLAEKCTEPVALLAREADGITAAMARHGVQESPQQFLRHIDAAIPAGFGPQPCRDIILVYAELRAPSH